MFSLIVTLIGIVIVAAAAIASIYYMGSVTDSHAQTAKVARLLNEAQQINGAILMYETDNAGQSISDLQDLVAAKYLKSLPDGNWSVSSQSVTRPVADEAQCKEFNKRLGYGEIVPSCSDPAWQNKLCCCQS